jgi:hypothetical protein
MKLKLDLNAMRVESFDAGPGEFAALELVDTGTCKSDCGCYALGTQGCDCYGSQRCAMNASDGSPRDTLCYHEYTGDIACGPPVGYRDTDPDYDGCAWPMNTARDCRSRKGC